MTEYNNGDERRRTPRKDVYLPIKLTAKENIVVIGRALDMSCYGVKLGMKLEITFKSKEEQQHMDEVLSSPELTLEIGDISGKLYILTTVEVKWTECNYGEGEKIYEAGLDLKLTDEQKQEWEKFYARL